jgi:ATP-binding cassette, subfamily B, bacterial
MFFDARLWGLTAGARRAMAVCVVVGIAAAVVGIVRLALLGWLIGRVFQGATVAELTLPFVAVAGVMILRGWLEHWRTMAAHRSAAQVQTALRARLHDKIMLLGPAYFGLERTGEVMLSLVEGVEQLEVWFGEYLPQLFVAAITPIVVFALLAPFDLVLASVLMVFALATLVAPAAFHRWDMENSMRRSRAYNAFAAEFLDSLQGLATLKAFGQSSARGQTLANKAHEVFRTTMWVLATNSLTRGITDTGLALGAATALTLGAYRVTEGQTELTTLLMVLMAGIEVFRPQRDLRSLLHNGMMGLSAAQGIFSVLQAESVVPAVQAKKPAAPLSPQVQFDDVRFSYPGTPRPAHNNLSFTINAGDRVGFVGSSGAGKSTVVKLLLRLYEPQSGRVSIGGFALDELPPEVMYQQLAVVSQDTFLFHGTVAENILFGAHGASEQTLRQAASDANALEFIDRLPQQFDTVIGERGVRLSGGQRQRLAIARALLRDAPILVLDEALSSVDAENEALILEALERLMKDRTTLVFAHRLSSVINLDQILVLDHGRVTEQGTHNELLAAEGAYFTLMREQLATGVGTVEQVACAADGCDNLSANAIDGQDATPAAKNDEFQDIEDGVVSATGLGWGEALRSLFSYSKPWTAKLIATFCFGVSRVIALIGVGVLSAMVVAAVKNGTPFEHLLVWLFVAAPLAGILHWLESWVAHDMAFRMLAEMRVDLFRKLDELAPAYLTRRRSGDLVSMATHDVEMVEYFFAHTIAPAFVAVLVPSAVLITLLTYEWTLAVVLLPFLALVALSPFMLRRRLDQLGSNDREALGELNAYVVDTVQGLAEVQAFQQADRRRLGFMQRVDAHLAARLPFYRDMSIQTSTLEVATGCGGLAVVIVASIGVHSGSLGAAHLPLLTLLALSAFLPVSEIAQIGRQLADTLGSTRRLHSVQQEQPSVAAPTMPSGFDPQDSTALRFDNVSFGYPLGQGNALTNVSFTLPRGSSLALVGPSGAGKTTIAQLCMRFWDAESGEVRLFGTPIRDIDLIELRNEIALVSQDTYLFNDTLRSNIMLANPGACAQALDEAIGHAALSDLVSSLPQGLDTPVGERGMRLSGGQRQRVAIARAFLKDAPILILDEATSHLDAVNERAVRDALDVLMLSRTTIVIAHRLSTVLGCDQILVLDRGQVIEQGTHDGLIGANGMYARLVERQAKLAV